MHLNHGSQRLCIPFVCKQTESALLEPSAGVFTNESLMHSFGKGIVLTQDTQTLCLENLLKWRKVNDQ